MSTPSTPTLQPSGPTAPRVRFLSLFVPDLAAAAERYAAVLGIAPREAPGAAPSAAPGAAPNPHPFAARGPVTFDLGQVCLALYECDGRTTQPGDVGIGVEVADPSATTEAVRATGGQVFFGPRNVPGDGREMAVFVTAERHFFELVKAQP